MTTNLINNKKYIGKHKSSCFDEKYQGSGILLRRAFKKYGIGNFKTIILEKCDNHEELNQKEMYYIQKYNCVKSDDFYNLSFGGDGGDTRAWMDKNTRSQVSSGKNNPMYGRKHTKETRRKMSQSKIGKKLKPFTDEHKAKLSESNKGKNKGKIPWNKGLKLSQEERDRLSKIHMGKKGTRTGMKNSEETRRKISEARKGRSIKTSLWRKCKIIYANETFKEYENLKDCARDNNISYTLAKTLVKQNEVYKDKHNKNPHIKGAKIIYLERI